MGAYRKEKVAGAIQEIVSTAIARRLNDPRVSPLTTVTRVRVTGDLLVATVYLSVPGDEPAERKTLAGMQHAGGFLRRLLAQELDMRQCPELRFEIDEGLKKVKHTLELMSENRRNRPDLFPPETCDRPPGEEASASAARDEQDGNEEGSRP